MKPTNERSVPRRLTSSTTRHLRTIVVLTVVGLVVFGASGLALAVLWPEDWNSTLGSFLLNVAASLVGVLLAILAAIFIVEGYLERRRREAEERAAADEKAYQEGWNAYAYGGISMLSLVLTHLSLYIAYGRERYMELAEEESSEVPHSVGEFIPGFLDALAAARAERRQASREGAEIRSGWGTEQAARLARVFKEAPPSPAPFTLKDLQVLARYLRIWDTRLREQMFLFQPFMPRRMGVAVVLAEVGRHLRAAREDTQDLIVSRLRDGDTTATFEVDSVFGSVYCELGRSSVELIQMVWAGPKDLDVVVHRWRADK